jgi:hypothetical protein
MLFSASGFFFIHGFGNDSVQTKKIETEWGLWYKSLSLC